MRLALLLAILLALPHLGCGGGDETDDELVLYTSVDEPTARAVVDEFERRTGLQVRMVTDTEANKSVGLAERLRAEARRPNADVWWGNEPFHTIRLADEGLFEAYEPATASNVLPMFRDEGGRWVGNGLRARVLAVDPQEKAAINSIRDLQNFDAVMARPTAGTTAGHVAALYALWGEAEADTFFAKVHANGARLVAGNGPAAREVGAGNATVALTDNDDVANVNRDATRVRRVIPDQEAGGLGTLAIPTTVALVAGGGDRAAAKQLVDFLASEEAEQMLIDSEFALASTRTGPESGGLRVMDIDYADVAERLAEAPRRALALLEGRAAASP